jgi:hypothetical protein
MPVVGEKVMQVGTVDRIEGSDIKLTKDDGERHRWLSLSWVTDADDAADLDRSDQQAMQAWLFPTHSKAQRWRHRGTHS